MLLEEGPAPRDLFQRSSRKGFNILWGVDAVLCGCVVVQVVVLHLS
jgi:hypothetical protein